MAINFGDILGGLGAAYGGTAQQYAQGIQQREQGLTERKRAELEARQRAMYEDANTAFGFLSNPELNYEQRADNIIRLAEDRLDALSNYPDADPSDTLQVLDLAIQMRDGTDPTAVTRLAKILAPAYQIYKQRYAPQQEAPEDTRVNYGLTPSYFEDEQGNIRLAQPSSTGGMQFIDLPEGMKPMLPASQRAFDPAAIAQQGAARTAVNVADIVATTDPTAAQAGAVTTAQQEAEIGLMEERARAESGAARISEQGARTGALQTKEDQLGLLSDLVGVAKQQSTGWTTGFIGSQLSKIPGTPAYDLSQTLDTLLASAGFETLQEMRNNSPTGGALGSVTERELALLQATWGSLQQSQSKEQFEANLDRFNQQLQQSWERVNNAYQRDYGVPYFQDGQRPMSPSPQTNDDPLGIFQTGAQ
jgi:hypothetical protein